MNKLELNEIEALYHLANKAVDEHKGSPFEALYKTIRGKLVKMFEEEYKSKQKTV